MPRTTDSPGPGPGRAAFADYERWIARQPLSERTRRTYCGRVGQYLDWLDRRRARADDPLADPAARDAAVRAFKAHLKHTRKAAPASVNVSLAAIDHFYRFVGLGPAAVAREPQPQPVPRALTSDEAAKVLRTARKARKPRDAAIVTTLLYTGLRLSELAGLDLADIALAPATGTITVRAVNGSRPREIPLNTDVRRALDAWLAVRTAPDDEPALFVSRSGGRLTARSIDFAVRSLGVAAQLDRPLSAHILRHTFCTNLVRAGHDLALVAELAGHSRLDTIRRYSLPSNADRHAVLEKLRITC